MILPTPIFIKTFFSQDLWLVVMFAGFASQAMLDKKLSINSYSVGVERAAFYVAPSISPFVYSPLYQKEVRHRLYPEINTNTGKKYKGQLPWVNRLVRFVQTLCAFVSLFLFGLALRNRFKIG